MMKTVTMTADQAAALDLRNAQVQNAEQMRGMVLESILLGHVTADELKSALNVNREGLTLTVTSPEPPKTDAPSKRPKITKHPKD